MRFSVLLLVLFWKLKMALRTNKAYRNYVGSIRLKILIKTADGRRGRLFVFERGVLTSRAGGKHHADVSLVWSDPLTAFKVMSSQSEEASFLAAAHGKMRIEGMPYFIQWFTDGVKVAMG